MNDNNKPDLPTTDELADLTRCFADLGALTRRLADTLAAKRLRGDAFTIPDKRVVARALLALAARLLADPGRLLQAQTEYQRELALLARLAARRLRGEVVMPLIEPEPGDRRFSHNVWRDDPRFDVIKQVYLLTARNMLAAVRAIKDQLDPQTANKVDFYLRQYLDAMAPTNMASLNPKVLNATRRSGGANLLNGWRQLLEDYQRGNGELRIRMTDAGAFRLGENIATTPGSVVFQTALMQLIQYCPATDRVCRRPLLIVPPWINKYYVLDQPPNQ